MRGRLVVILGFLTAGSLAFHLDHGGVAQAAVLVAGLLALSVASDLGDGLGRRPLAEVLRLVAAGDEEGATAALDAALARRPHDVALLALRGRRRLERGDAAGAGDDAVRLLARSPLHEGGLDLLVGATLRQRDPVTRAHALRELERRLSLTLDALGDSPALLCTRALTRVVTEDGWGALADADRAAALGARDDRVTVARAWARAATGDMTGARALVDPLVDDAGEDVKPDHLLVRGFLRLVADDLGGATSDLTDLLRHAPDTADALRCRGQARALEGDADGAERDLEAALAKDEDPSTLLWLLLLGRREALERLAADDPRRWDAALARALLTGDPTALTPTLADAAPTEAERRACLRAVHAARALAAERAGNADAARAAWAEVLALGHALDPLLTWARRRSAGDAPA
ncbi:MAG: hypothetical protein M9894_39435 [Planctomycetes bacterium]|nr:hypothetical protein [Planctomycetota bacterium]